ncbi:hypothetical protein [Streptomyces tamarix]
MDVPTGQVTVTSVIPLIQEEVAGTVRAAGYELATAAP